MVRPREFDISHALEAAMEVFWAKGYEATSMTDLLGAMGISKSSLYDTFGNKHELFIAAMDRYAAEVADEHERAFLSAPSGRRAIEDSFARIVDDAFKPEGERGCFAVNCAVEVSATDPQAAERVRQSFARYERNFEAVIARAQAMGEIPADKDARALARFLTSSAHGLRIMAKANPDRAALDDVKATILAALD